MKRNQRDPHDVAEVVAKALAVGVAATPAVALHYRISYNTASHVIRRARDAGAGIPHLGSGPVPGQRRTQSDVAMVARDAAASGASIALAVAARFKVSKRTATRIVSEARMAGHDIPYNYGKGERVEAPPRECAPSGDQLRCTCGESFPVDAWEPSRALIAHTLTVHGRPPYRHERIPQEVAA